MLEVVIDARWVFLLLNLGFGVCVFTVSKEEDKAVIDPKKRITVSLIHGGLHLMDDNEMSSINRDIGGGRSGGHAEPQPRTPANRGGTIHNETEWEDSPPVENETNSMHTEESVVLEPTVREAIVNEVYQVIHNTIPEIMADALKDNSNEVRTGKKGKEKVGKRGTRRKDKEPENVISSDEDRFGVCVFTVSKGEDKAVVDAMKRITGCRFSYDHRKKNKAMN
ncbi:hypothetical protein L1987_21468 [Smallanthus sonchifolius]|uniref:Uncharacterized protein n=1 Tax=Smallanthus sonchifolius TaxID=185202 RepID=A0ACB9IUP2_9ASTR|nr:hypothetical protein L1987_21468 [Smallanthus sonchifolius]